MLLVYLLRKLDCTCSERRQCPLASSLARLLDRLPEIFASSNSFGVFEAPSKRVPKKSRRSKICQLAAVCRFFRIARDQQLSEEFFESLLRL